MKDPNKSGETNTKSRAMQVCWIPFALAVPISFYVILLGTIFMGFCSGIRCLPHNFAWILLTPILLIFIWSLRTTAIAAVSLLATHVFTEVVIYGGGLNTDTLWGNDKALDKCTWISVFLLVLSAVLSRKTLGKNESTG
jgi:hypothetical protein